MLSNPWRWHGRRVRLRDLAARMLWSASPLSQHVAQMEKRRSGQPPGVPSDGRGAEVVLTDAGLRAIELAAPARSSRCGHLIDLLAPRQVQALREITEQVVAHLNDLDSRPWP